MTEKVKELAPKIWEEIQKSQKILMHLHPSPDADAAGSALALAFFLKKLGKEVTIIGGDSSLPETLNFLPGFSQIIPKNYFQITPQDFDLFLIIDTSSLNQISKVDKVILPETLTTIVIDHHATNENFAKINLAETSYPATAQIIYDLFQLWGVEITPEMAICLFMGVYTDSMFKYSKTNHDTFLMAADLINKYPDFAQAVLRYENNQQAENISYLGLALSSLEKYFSGKVIVSIVPNQELIKRGIKQEHTEKMEIANYIKSVIGWEIGISFTEVRPQVVNISLRTRDEKKYDVSKIAAATGFGGGHPAAAGATLKMPFAEAKKFLLETIKKVYPELGEP